MNSQLALNLDRRSPPPLPPGRMRDLVAILDKNGGWMTRRQLEGEGFTERELRELAENDNAIPPLLFSYPGSPGYKLFRKVTHEEFARCISLRNQGRVMTRRWIRYQRGWHNIYGGSQPSTLN
jgi:hypothetical protein